MVLALKAVTAVSLAPFMNNDARLGVNALLLLFAPEPKMLLTCASVTLFKPTNAGVAHCITTERKTGAPASSIDASTVVEAVCARLIRKQEALGLTTTPLNML